MDRLKEWFEEASAVKVFKCKTHDFVMQKGFKITYYLKDNVYSILDTRFNDFYTDVSEDDMKTFMDNGFLKGTRIIMHERNVKRVDHYLRVIESIYTKKAKYKKALNKNKPFYEKRIRNCNDNIHKYHDMMQFYLSKVEQHEQEQLKTVKLN